MYELQVENMSCGHCVASVTKAVKGVDGAARVDIDLAGKQVKVETSADLDVIKAAIMDAGYPVTGAHYTPSRPAPDSGGRSRPR